MLKLDLGKLIGKLLLIYLKVGGAWSGDRKREERIHLRDIKKVGSAGLGDQFGA